jgi:hypothetical protein
VLGWQSFSLAGPLILALIVRRSIVFVLIAGGLKLLVLDLFLAEGMVGHAVAGHEDGVQAGYLCPLDASTCLL